jgi:hypothetical protein
MDEPKGVGAFFHGDDLPGMFWLSSMIRETEKVWLKNNKRNI